MDRTPQIRPAVPREIDSLFAVRRSAILALTATMDEERIHAWARRERREPLAKAIAEGRVWVAADANDVLGWIGAAGDLITWLYVRPDRAGQGIGTRLLERAEAVVRLAGFVTVRLESGPNAEAFYRNRGYRAVGNTSPAGTQPMIKPLSSVQGTEMRQ